MVKIIISMTWAIVIALNVTMGVAWHRFLAFPNIFFKRTARRRAGARRAAADDVQRRGRSTSRRPIRRRTSSASRQVEQFTWKGLLDFSTCTECGRCQSQCPAWNTGKPLSPKLLVMSLRDHALRQGAVPAGRRRQTLTGEEKASRSSSPE